MNSTRDDTDATTYELFIRRTFNCDRGDIRYPFADSNVWIDLINKWNYVNDPTRSKNSLPQRTKDYNTYFKTVAEYIDKTIDYALKKHASKEGNESMYGSFSALKSKTAKAASVEDLRGIVAHAISLLDEFKIILK